MRIGFAFNRKPEPGTGDSSGSEEPPSRRSRSARRQDRYAEWDDPATIAAVAAALARAGEVVLLEADADFPGKLRAAGPDIVFNIAEGLNGPSREAQVPAICEFFGIPYTGSDPLTLGLALDKRRAKEVFLARGVPTPAWFVLGNGEAAPEHWTRGAGPWLVKPVFEGSSMGIPASALCRSPDEVCARVSAIVSDYAQPALVEQFLPGREFTVGILGNDKRVRVLPPVEIRFDALPPGAPPIYGYEAKWVWDTSERPLDIFACPASLDAPLANALDAAARAAYGALGCRDWARIDLRLDAAGTPAVIEVNPLPGILPDARQNSCLPKAARAAGIDYDTLILSVLRSALERWGLTA
jgi:D-alanine-D-alanine ligase